jgi:uncharacterized protein DUF3105
MATTKRRTAGVQRRGRASDAAMQRRVNQRGGAMPIDWRLLIVGGVLVLGVIVLVIVLVFGGGSSARVGVQQVDDGGGHIQDGSAGGPYSSVPATSGQHWTTPANWGVYTTANPAVESQVIHNLEHGGIVIWYQSTATQGDIDALTQFTQQALNSANHKVILSPWNGQDFGHPIAVTAWDWMLLLDNADIDQVRAFQADHPASDAPEPFGGP